MEAELFKISLAFRELSDAPDGEAEELDLDDAAEDEDDDDLDADDLGNSAPEDEDEKLTPEE